MCKSVVCERASMGTLHAARCVRERASEAASTHVAVYEVADKRALGAARR